MDALPDIKQLQVETKRLSQGIDKMVNPPMVGDIQLKNQPASLLPGGVTYVNGMTVSGKAGFAPAYLVNPQVKEMMEQMSDLRTRIKEINYNNLFQTISQFETRSNVTATEIDARRAEAMLMLGPVLQRLNHEAFAPAHERIFDIAKRAGILPLAPREIQGADIHMQFTSMIELAQNGAQAAGIERLFNMIGALAGIDPAAADNVDIDYGLDKVSYLYNNDPKLIRSPQELAAIRDQRNKEQQAQRVAAQAGTVKDVAAGAKTLAETPMTGGNLLTRLTGQA
jgi:hypothetical protein